MEIATPKGGEVCRADPGRYLLYFLGVAYSLWWLLERGWLMQTIKADVVIVGGVTGAVIARELSRYDLKVVVLERRPMSEPAAPAKPTRL